MDTKLDIDINIMTNSIIDENFLSKLEAVSMHMQNPMRGYFGGTHRTKSYGSTVEFADFREYALGDDIRRIDWNLYSRFEKYFIRLFVDEKQMHIQIFLDGSAVPQNLTNITVRLTSVRGQNTTKQSCIWKQSLF